MWNMSQIEREDLNGIRGDTAIDWEQLNGASVLITGATGLIGKSLIKALLYCSTARIIAPVRDCERAKKIFSSQLEAGCSIHFLHWDAEQPLTVDGPVDYIVHCASQTSSSGFVQNPVQTIRTAYLGTEHVLELARQKNGCRVVYLSTMEVYGTPQGDRKISEDFLGCIDPLNVRSCYPESKRLCENLCVGYSSEYQVNVSIARLTQTFGPGISPKDGRVFAEFARCVLDGCDIVLHTKGETKRNYLYTADAVRGLLIIALRGESGQAYNVANEQTYCTIYEMAQMVSSTLGKGKIAVRVEQTEDLGRFGYAPVLKMNLDTGKLRRLGWEPRVGLQDMFRRMIAELGGGRTIT